ncbi:MAG: polysaccharide biosynthesis C-terminal domain-containing protein, partial [Pygmaiobacter sp.]
LLFIGAAVLIYCAKLLLILLTASLTSPYFPAWRYVPVLVIATIFSCFVNFMGSIYMVEKRSGQNLVTMMAGAILNLILNYFLIPPYGPNGAAFATFASYLLVFILRAINTRQYLALDLHLPRMCISVVLLMAESVLLIYEIPNWQLWCAIPALTVIVLNARPLLRSMLRLLRHTRPPHA